MGDAQIPSLRQASREHKFHKVIFTMHRYSIFIFIGYFLIILLDPKNTFKNSHGPKFTAFITKAMKTSLKL